MVAKVLPVSGGRGALGLIATLLLVPCMGQYTWKRVYGGVERDVARAVKALPDGGAVICGSTGSFGTAGGDLYLIRVDQEGDRTWSLVVGGPGVQEGRAVVLLPDGGFLAVGITDTGEHGGYDGYAVRVSAEGAVLWERSYGTAAWDFLSSGDFDGTHLVLGGTTFGMDDPAGDLLLLRMDLMGEVLWMNGYGTSGSDDGGYVRVLSTGSYVVAGTTGDGEEADGLVCAVGVDGTAQWCTRVEEAGTQWVGGIDVDDQDAVFLAGYMFAGEEHRRMYLAKVSATGQVLMSRPVSSGGADWEARTVRALADGRISVAGYTEEHGAGDRDISMLFLDPGGEFLSGPTYGGAQRDEAWSMDLANDGAYYIAGSTRSFGPGAESFFVIRSDGDTLNGPVGSYSDPVGVREGVPSGAFRVVPMPLGVGAMAQVHGGGAISRVVFRDVVGRRVAEVRASSGEFLVPTLVPGVYTLQLYEDLRLRSAQQVLIE